MPGQLLEELEGRGIKLRLDGDKLRYTAPPDALTPELRLKLQARKAELVQHLSTATTLCPASFAQKRFWTLQQLDPKETFYHAPFLFKILGAVDPGVVRSSFDAMVARHEILRTVLKQIDGQLMQVISPKGEVAWFETRMPGASQSDLHAWMADEARRPFDLAAASGLHVAFASVPGTEPSEDASYLQICFHNTLFDHPTLLNVLKEFSAHYNALVSGVPVGLPPVTQYSEYAKWQAGTVAPGSSLVEERRQYWRDWFRAGEPPPWTWRNQNSGPQAKNFDSHLLWHRYSADLTRRLHASCRRHAVTPYIAIVAAYFLLLRRYSGCSDITVGTTYVIRPDWRFESMIGASEVVPALRVDLGDNPTIASLLGRVKDVVTSALTYQDIPLKEVFPDRQGGPLFKAVFSAYPETLRGKLQLNGLDVEWVEDWMHDQTRPDLYLVTWETETGGGRELGGVWLPKKSLFDLDAANEMNTWFGGVLEAIADDPGKTVAELIAD